MIDRKINILDCTTTGWLSTRFTTVPCPFEIREYSEGPYLEESPELILFENELPQGITERFCHELESGCVGLLQLGDFEFVDGIYAIPRNVSARELLNTLHLVAENSRLQRRELQNELTQKRLSDWAFQDPLTDLPNRRAWQRELDDHLVADHPICVALIDIDYFKLVNDQSGHDVGDEVLMLAAKATQNNLRENDFVARLGGDEFGIIIANVNQTVAEQIVSRIRDQVHLHLKSVGLPAVTLSAGYVFCNDTKNHDARQIYKSAALSLKKAKARSRNCTLGHVL